MVYQFSVPEYSSESHLGITKNRMLREDLSV